MNWVITFVGLMILIVIAVMLIVFLFDLVGVIVDGLLFLILWIVGKAKGNDDDI